MADRRYRRVLLGVVLIGIGIGAGVLWHEPIERLLETRKRDATPTGASKQLWTCSMHPQVVTDRMGLCPICHMELVPIKKTQPSGEQPRQASPGERKIKFWWDPMMTPPYTSDKPGRSPMGMELVPVYEDEVGPSGPEVTVEPAVVQNLGVRTTTVTEGPLKHTIRAFGTLEEAQPNIRDINLRVSGWVRKMHIATEGEHVEGGAPLFDLYSPELQLAIEELIAARRSALATGQPSPDAQALQQSAHRKLELLGLGRAQVDELAELDRAPDTVTFKAPISGHITEKLIVEGAAVKSGDRVLRLVDHTLLWIDAQVYEQDLAFVKIGAKASATVASRPRNVYDGQIIFIHPHVDRTTRAAVARLEVRNAGMALKPGMYATVRIESLGPDRAVLVPREAVIDSGEMQIALVARGGGRFEPRRVKTGLSADDGMIQIVAGLSAGETVVTSGQFLLDSESRLRESLQKFLGADGSREEPPTPAERP